MIQIIQDINSLESIKEQWIALYNISANVSVFQNYYFIKSSIAFSQNSSANLFIIVVNDAQLKKAIAIFPCILTHNGVLEFINQRHSDFCGALVDPTKDHYNLYKEVGEFLKNNKRIKRLDFQNLTSESALLSSLKYHFRYTIVHDFNFFPLVPICPNVSDKQFTDAFITIPSKKRWNLKKLYTQVNDSCLFKFINKLNHPFYPQQVIDTLVNSMIQQKIRTKSYFSDSMLSWWKDMYENGILSFAIVYEAGIPKSCTLIFYDNTKNECVTWIMLYDDNKWNMRSNLLISQYIYENGMGTLNLARGIYDYKVVNFHPDVKPLFRVMIAKSKWGHFKNIMSTALHYSKPIVKAFLGR